jgi:glucose-fructose oxidoreductase
MAVKSGDSRFKDTNETVSAVLRFPNNKIATFTTSFGLHDTNHYEAIGTKGRLRVEPAFEWQMPLKHYMTIGEKTTEKEFTHVDHFAGELQYFSRAVLNDLDIEPSGEEGLLGIKIIEALHKSLQSKKTVSLESTVKARRPKASMVQEVPPQRREPPLIEVEAPHG